MTKVRIARRKRPPASTAVNVRKWSSEGYSKKGIAHRLNTSLATFNRWMDEQPELQKAFDEGREREHKVLFTSLFNAAKKGNTVAAMFLLKTRHGYREGDQTDMANRVSILFSVPGAMPLDAFKEAIANERAD